MMENHPPCLSRNISLASLLPKRKQLYSRTKSEQEQDMGDTAGIRKVAIYIFYLIIILQCVLVCT